MSENYTLINWQNGEVTQPAIVEIDGVDYQVQPAIKTGNTPINADNLNHMDNGIRNATLKLNDKIETATVKLIAVSATAPSECSEGDKYYNTSTNLIYTATGTDTWGVTGETPSELYLYMDISDEKLYYYDGTTFSTYGGGSGGEEVFIQATEPTAETAKLWIDTDELLPEEKERVRYEYGETNLFNVTNITIGYWVNAQGQYNANAGWNIGELIAVEPNTDYTISRQETTGAMQTGIAEYDTNGNFVQQQAQWQNNVSSKTYTTSNTTKYIRPMYNNTYSMTNIQVEKGSTATSYEPYVQPSILVDENEIYNKSKLDNLTIYSQTEKRVGTWIDGKPIYRKTFQIPSSTYSSRRLDTDIVSSTVSQIWLVSPSFSHEYENGVVTETYNLLGGGYNGSSDWLYVRINHGGNVITIDLRNDGGRMIDGYITLEYTKTTD